MPLAFFAGFHLGIAVVVSIKSLSSSGSEEVLVILASITLPASLTVNLTMAAFIFFKKFVLEVFALMFFIR